MYFGEFERYNIVQEMYYLDNNKGSTYNLNEKKERENKGNDE